MARTVENISITDDRFWALLNLSLQRKGIDKCLWARIERRQAQDGHYFYRMEIIKFDGTIVKDILGDIPSVWIEIDRDSLMDRWDKI